MLLSWDCSRKKSWGIFVSLVSGLISGWEQGCTFWVARQQCSVEIFFKIVEVLWKYKNLSHKFEPCKVVSKNNLPRKFVFFHSKRENFNLTFNHDLFKINMVFGQVETSLAQLPNINIILTYFPSRYSHMQYFIYWGVEIFSKKSLQCGSIAECGPLAEGP